MKPPPIALPACAEHSSLGAVVKGLDEAVRRSPITTNVAGERHYTVEEVGKMWNLGNDSVRRIFRNVPGVLVLGSDNSKRGTRRYETLRIPQSVLDRVHAQYSVANYVPTN